MCAAHPGRLTGPKGKARTTVLCVESPGLVARLTRVHVERLERSFDELGQQPGGHKCKGMEGLLAEGDELLETHDESDALDAAIIAAAQR